MQITCLLHLRCLPRVFLPPAACLPADLRAGAFSHCLHLPAVLGADLPAVILPACLLDAAGAVTCRRLPFCCCRFCRLPPAACLLCCLPLPFVHRVCHHNLACLVFWMPLRILVLPTAATCRLEQDGCRFCRGCRYCCLLLDYCRFVAWNACHTVPAPFLACRSAACLLPAGACLPFLPFCGLPAYGTCRFSAACLPAVLPFLPACLLYLPGQHCHYWIKFCLGLRFC